MTRAQLRTHVTHDTNTEHDFPVGGSIKDSLPQPPIYLYDHPAGDKEVGGGGNEGHDGWRWVETPWGGAGSGSAHPGALRERTGSAIPRTAKPHL